MNPPCDALGLLSVDKAKEHILSTVNALNNNEDINIYAALDRVLGEDVIANMNVPIADNSAMDGYALCFNGKQTHYQLVGTVYAGDTYTDTLQPGQCVRIMTGAAIPQNTDAVVMQENTKAEGDNILLSQQEQKGANIRRAGEDISKGNVLLTKGRKLTPADLGLLASIGIASVKVVRPLHVAVFSTGNELTPPSEPLKPGAIYESNRAVLIAALKQQHCVVHDFGIIKDDKNAIKDAFLQADKLADVVISSGGVSVGEADFTKEVLNEIGDIGFWKIAMKPGKPFAFGKLPTSVFFGLPGNPVSSMVTFMQLVIPALTKLSGQSKSATAHPLKATTLSAIKKRPGRTDFQRGIAHINQLGQYQVMPLKHQGSGVLTSMSEANCFIVLTADCGTLEKGAKVEIELF